MYYFFLIPVIWLCSAQVSLHPLISLQGVTLIEYEVSQCKSDSAQMGSVSLQWIMSWVSAAVTWYSSAPLTSVHSISTVSEETSVILRSSGQQGTAGKSTECLITAGWCFMTVYCFWMPNTQGNKCCCRKAQIMFKMYKIGTDNMTKVAFSL